MVAPILLIFLRVIDHSA